MVKRVLIIGGYGNFGKYIAKKLSADANIKLIISGRNEKKAKELAAGLQAKNLPEACYIDINKDLAGSLKTINPDIVIHTSGPYQEQGYHVAKCCIDNNCHYIDLADARQFVVGISKLDQAAKQKKVLICSGASSVPCLTAAIIDKYKNQFEKLEEIEYAIATAQLVNRGLATVSSGLSYAGKEFETIINGKKTKVYGWLDLKVRRFKSLGYRLMGNCDVPDLEIFPKRYKDLKTIRFQAALEIKFLQLVLWLLAGLVRFKVIKSLQPLAKIMLKSSFIFDVFGGNNTGFYMLMTGVDGQGEPKQVRFDIKAEHGDGLYIPSAPAIIMARKLASGEIKQIGATPCVDFITLDEYLDELKGLDIGFYEG